jgi:hypothetical protein
MTANMEQKMATIVMAISVASLFPFRTDDVMVSWDMP